MSLLKSFGIDYPIGDYPLFNWNHYCAPYKPYKPWWQRDEQPWSIDTLTYTPVVYPSQLTDEKTGEVTEIISFDVPGLTAKDIKVSWDKSTRTLTLVGNNEKLGKSYVFSLNTFSVDLDEGTFLTAVENGIATVSGKLKSKSLKDKLEGSVMDVPVK